MEEVITKDDKENIVGRLLNKPKCWWASKSVVDKYNREFSETIVRKCNNYASWHDRFCKKHHKEGWGKCSCCKCYN